MDDKTLLARLEHGGWTEMREKIAEFNMVIERIGLPADVEYEIAPEPDAEAPPAGDMLQPGGPPPPPVDMPAWDSADARAELIRTVANDVIVAGRAAVGEGSDDTAADADESDSDESTPTPGVQGIEHPLALAPGEDLGSMDSDDAPEWMWSVDDADLAAGALTSDDGDLLSGDDGDLLGGDGAVLSCAARSRAPRPRPPPSGRGVPWHSSDEEGTEVAVLCSAADSPAPAPRPGAGESSDSEWGSDVDVPIEAAGDLDDPRLAGDDELLLTDAELAAALTVERLHGDDPAAAHAAAAEIQADPERFTNGLLGARARLQMRVDRLEEDAALLKARSQPLPSSARHKVYVLTGGDAAERHVGLAAAASTLVHLQKAPDIEATLFVLAPTFSGMRERDRRREMLRRRTQLLDLGVDEEDISETLDLDLIRRPALVYDVPLKKRLVWAVPAALVGRWSVEEIVEACDLMLQHASTAPAARALAAEEQRHLTMQMCWEARTMGLSGVGATFEGIGDEPYAAATNMTQFMLQARVRSMTAPWPAPSRRMPLSLPYRECCCCTCLHVAAPSASRCLGGRPWTGGRGAGGRGGGVQRDRGGRGRGCLPDAPLRDERRRLHRQLCVCHEAGRQ